jgi:nitrite reductase/ring-hydroxylating ferredoxin subunit
MTTPPTAALLERLEDLSAIDEPAGKLGKAVRDAIPGGVVKQALSGQWLGHAFHPVAAYVPLGTWMSSTILDLVGGRRSRDAADLLVGVGLLGTLPAAITGASDWADGEIADDGLRRVGVVHALSNVAAQGIMTWSLAERRRGRRGRGKLLGLAGASVVGFSGWLGGHLAYGLGSGVDQTTFLEPLTDWTPTDVSGAQVREGELAHGRASDVDLVLTRLGGEVRALADRCCHRGGPLHEGSFEDGCVVCPWHSSKFSFEDGSCIAGPGPYPQRSYDVREDGGRLEVRARR